MMLKRQGRSISSGGEYSFARVCQIMRDELPGIAENDPSPAEEQLIADSYKVSNAGAMRRWEVSLRDWRSAF